MRSLKLGCSRFCISTMIFSPLSEDNLEAHVGEGVDELSHYMLCSLFFSYTRKVRNNYWNSKGYRVEFGHLGCFSNTMRNNQVQRQPFLQDCISDYAAKRGSKKNATTLAGSGITSLCLTKNPFQLKTISGSFSFDSAAVALDRQLGISTKIVTKKLKV